MRAEIKEVVTLSTHKTSTHTCFYQNQHVRGLPCVKRWSTHPTIGVYGGCYITNVTMKLLNNNDVEFMDKSLSFRCFIQYVFKRTMNIRLQYSKKVKCKN